jgi:hypothetical protein
MRIERLSGTSSPRPRKTKIQDYPNDEPQRQHLLARTPTLLRRTRSAHFIPLPVPILIHDPPHNMARAGHSGTVVGSAVVVREKYYWPDLQLNIWTIVMLATASLILGVNAQFMQIQNAMGLGTPWYDEPLSSFP